MGLQQQQLLIRAKLDARTMTGLQVGRYREGTAVERRREHPAITARSMGFRWP
jgi:hypothetical protein